MGFRSILWPMIPLRTPRAVLVPLASLATLLFAWSAAAAPEAPPAAEQPKIEGVDPAKLKRGPWHYTDVWMKYDPEDFKGEFQSLELDFEIKGKVPDDLPLYIAPIGALKLDGQMFYGGIQTNSWMNRNRENPKPSDRRAIGRGCIFSLWDDRDLDHIQQAAGGFFDSSDHEGDFISVRNRLAWGEGRFTYRLSRLRTETDADGSRHAWIGAFVANHAGGEETFVGALRFKGEGLRLESTIPFFVEVYGGRPLLERLPIGTSITFGATRFNGRTVRAPRADAQFDRGIPDLLEVVPVNAKGEVLTEPKAEEVAGVRCTFVAKAIQRPKRYYRLW